MKNKFKTRRGSKPGQTHRNPVQHSRVLFADDFHTRVYAAFMHMVDRQLGEILTLLKELEIDDNTILFLCGDNGGQAYFQTKERPHGFFGPNLNPKTGERFRASKGPPPEQISLRVDE